LAERHGAIGIGGHRVIGVENGNGRGFQFTVPADTTLQTLYVYVGEHNGTGAFTASLNDGSGATTQELNGGIPGGGVLGAYALNFQADHPGSRLTVSWVQNTTYGADATVIMEAAALKTAAVPEPTTLAFAFAGLTLLAVRRKK